MTKYFVTPGQVFGRLTVVGSVFSTQLYGQLTRLVNCQCECGLSKNVPIKCLFTKNSQSCGCLQIERSTAAMRAANITHGESHKTTEHSIWKNMISRCHSPSSSCYSRYGGAGISVCKKWRHSFPAFLLDVGRRPSKDYSLDRWANNKGNYEPGNVRWATVEEQQANRKDNHYLTFDGKTMLLSRWAELHSIGHSTISRRLKCGWSVEKALTVRDGRSSRGQNL